MLSQVLADPITVGFEGLDNTTVARVSVAGTRKQGKGIVPKNLQHLVGLLEEAKGIIELQVSEDSIIALDPVEAREANQRILERYHIRRDRSQDLAS